MISVQAAIEEVPRADQDEQHQDQLHQRFSLHPRLNVVRHSQVWWVVLKKVKF